MATSKPFRLCCLAPCRLMNPDGVLTERGRGISNRPVKYPAVKLVWCDNTDFGNPEATISPPKLPAAGPMSMR